MIHKGAGKSPELDCSWRSLSCCELVAKILDSYIVELYGARWLNVQAQNQFQGPGSSPELALVAVTEAISYSVNVKKSPLFLLLLDQYACFDRILRQHVVKAAYFADTSDEALLYLDGRLGSRQTFVQWGQEVLGPIQDTVGLEQGGCTYF